MATSSVLGGRAHSQSSWTAAAKRTVSRQGLLARAWRCCRCQWHGQEPRRSRPPGGITWGALRDMSSSLGQWGAGTTPRGVTRSSRWPIPGKLKRRVLSEERGGCCSPRPSCGYSRATRRGTSHPLNCRRFQPSQSTDPLQPAFALGSPVGVGIEGLAGEVESSCSHPREAMNLVHVRRISRRNRTASLFQHAVSTHLGHRRGS